MPPRSPTPLRSPTSSSVWQPWAQRPPRPQPRPLRPSSLPHHNPPAPPRPPQVASTSSSHALDPLWTSAATLARPRPACSTAMPRLATTHWATHPPSMARPCLARARAAAPERHAHWPDTMAIYSSQLYKVLQMVHDLWLWASSHLTIVVMYEAGLACLVYL
jgi:hypothetical protein